ncbi:MAG: hypothetical protein E6G51_02975 [Actinobacteria bacterium]|nr:MAG: hypothetical protein E6G51_02975 [Actinomycetota bacterium]
MTIAAGEVYWAVVPYTPQAPFQVFVKDKPPVAVPDAGTIVEGLRKGGDAELRFVVEAKARPVLLLSDRVDPRTGDLFGLRLVRLGSLGEEAAERIREQREPGLFHLKPERFPDLDQESAAMISAPIRLHESAVYLAEPLGRLDQNEMRVLAERFVTYWELDLHQLLIGKIRELLRKRES